MCGHNHIWNNSLRIQFNPPPQIRVYSDLQQSCEPLQFFFCTSTFIKLCKKVYSGTWKSAQERSSGFKASCGFWESALQTRITNTTITLGV
jgi:hypothetical protein